MRLLLLFVLTLFIQTAAGQTSLLAENDFFNTNSDSSITVSGPGLLDNDMLVDDSLQVILVSEPTNGTVNLGPDGSFTYTPNPQFSGIDEFTYQLKTLPLQALPIDTLQSLLNFNMTVDLPVVGDDDADAEGRVGGTAYLYINDDEAQLYDMNLSIIDPLELGFRFGNPIVLARLFVNAEANAFQLTQTRRSEPALLTDGLFRQDSAKVQVMGVALLEGTGLIGGEIPEDPQEFDTETDAALEIQLTFSDSMLTAEVPVDLNESFELSGNAVDLIVDGKLTAHGPLQEAIVSNVATVSITVDPLSRASTLDETPFAYSLSQNYPNPFNPTTTITYSIPEPGDVRLTVFDLLGREVAALVDEVQVPGNHQVVFDATGLPSGMYVYRLESGGYSNVKTLVVVR